MAELNKQKLEEKIIEVLKSCYDPEIPVDIFELALKGEWQGTRSSALSRQWRVIYAVRGDELTVCVLEVNPHDYRKKN